MRAQHRRGGELFVDAGGESNIMLFQRRAAGPEFPIIIAKGRTAVAGDETGGVEAGLFIGLGLQQGNAHQRLSPGQENLPGGPFIAVIQLVIVKRNRLRLLGCGVGHRVSPIVYAIIILHSTNADVFEAGNIIPLIIRVCPCDFV